MFWNIPNLAFVYELRSKTLESQFLSMLMRFCIFGRNICVTTEGTGEARDLQLHGLKSLTIIGSTDTVLIVCQSTGASKS